MMADERKALEVKRVSKRSFKNLRDAARYLQGKPHEPFSTRGVREASVGYVRKIMRDAGMTLDQIEHWADGQMKR